MAVLQRAGTFIRVEPKDQRGVWVRGQESGIRDQGSEDRKHWRGLLSPSASDICVKRTPTLTLAATSAGPRQIPRGIDADADADAPSQDCVQSRHDREKSVRLDQIQVTQFSVFPSFRLANIAAVACYNWVGWFPTCS